MSDIQFSFGVKVMSYLICISSLLPFVRFRSCFGWSTERFSTSKSPPAEKEESSLRIWYSTRLPRPLCQKRRLVRSRWYLICKSCSMCFRDNTIAHMSFKHDNIKYLIIRWKCMLRRDLLFIWTLSMFGFTHSNFFIVSKRWMYKNLYKYRTDK